MSHFLAESLRERCYFLSLVIVKNTEPCCNWEAGAGPGFSYEVLAKVNYVSSLRRNTPTIPSSPLHRSVEEPGSGTVPPPSGLLTK